MRYSPKDLPGHTAFLVVTTGMALAGVLLLTLLARTRIVKEVLRTFAGLTSVLMLPLCWLYTAALYREAYNLPDALRLWLYFELGLVVAVVFIFLFARRFLPGWIVAGLFVAHHILWGRLFLGGPYFWLSPFLTLVPVTGLCASMAWLVYASRQLRADNVI